MEELSERVLKTNLTEMINDMPQIFQVLEAAKDFASQWPDFI